MLPREVDGAVLQGFLHKGGADDRPAEVRLLSQGRGSGLSTSGEEKARGSCRARHRVRRPRPQLRPLRLRSAGSSMGPRSSRACDWPPGPARPRERLPPPAGGQGSPGPLPAPPEGVLLSLSVLLSQLIPQQPGGAEEGWPGEDCTACTPIGAHACTDTPVPFTPLHPWPWGHRQGAGSWALTRPRPTPSGAELWGPRPDGASGTLTGPP